MNGKKKKGVIKLMDANNDTSKNWWMHIHTSIYIYIYLPIYLLTNDGFAWLERK